MKAKAFFAVLLLFLVAANSLPALAQGTPVTVKSVDVTSQFPEGVLFQVAAQTASPARIQEIRLEMKVKGSTSSAYAYLEFPPGPSVEGKYLLRTGGAQYKPPGILIDYFFIITTSEGRSLETEKATYLYLDNRFEWSRVAAEMVEVYYYGAGKPRADVILRASEETIERMGALLGVRPAQPVRVIAYNNPQDMASALIFQGQAVQRELLTQGQAWYDFGILLVLAGDPLVDGVASHEMTHMLVREASLRAFAGVPTWLNEGLAEYGNINPGTSYDVVLSEAAAANRLLLLRHMQAMPGTSRDIILFYGQARAIVKYLVDTYGGEKLRDLFAAFNRGLRADEALKAVYGFDLDGLDNTWRKTLGVPPVAPAPQEAPVPLLPSPGPEAPRPAPLGGSPIAMGGAAVLLAAVVVLWLRQRRRARRKSAVSSQ